MGTAWRVVIGANRRLVSKSLSMLLGLVAVWCAPSYAEPPVVYHWFKNFVEHRTPSKDAICAQDMIDDFTATHPGFTWTNGRFLRFGPGTSRYISNASITCVMTSSFSPNDERGWGSILCDADASGDSANQWTFDTKLDKCVCVSGLVTENGKCVQPTQAGCELIIEGVCHGGVNNGGCTEDRSAPQCLVGNPVNPGTGNKFEPLPVYRGPNGFELVLSFNSQDDDVAHFGRRWRNSFDRRIYAFGTSAVAYRPDGKALLFTSSGAAWLADAGTASRLTELKDAAGARTGWQLYAPQGDQVEGYDDTGKLLSITSRSGLVQTLFYSDGTSGPDGGVYLDAGGEPTTRQIPAGWLIRAADHFGRTLQFSYDIATARVGKVVDPAGGVHRFGYDALRNLGSVTFADGQTRTFHYNESVNTSGAYLPHALTGVTDENGVRFATFKYDTQGRAISSAHAGGADAYTFTYNVDGSVAIADALSTTRTYAFQKVLGAFNVGSIAGPACPSCGPAAQTFDSNGNVASRTDWNGNRTNYGYDLLRNLQTSRTEGLTAAGATTPQTRTVTTEWHPTFRLPSRIAEPLRITTNVYDPDGSQCGARGAQCSRSVEATTDANGSQGFSATPTADPARTWTYTYNGNGSVLTVDGPRTDVPDVTTYTHYANDDPDLGKRGNAATIRNAAGHVTSITAYNAHGQPETIVDANGLTTTLTYDARQRLKTRTVGSELTTYDYDGVGQVTKVTLPDVTFLSYGYDAAHRLTSITDNAGNRIVYTLDAMGNRIGEQVFDAAQALAQTRSRVYSNLNRLFRELGALNQTTEYAYDDQGNVLSVKDPLLRETSNQYDALNRLKQVTDPALGVTQYAYNGLDSLIGVTDPRNLTTGYTVDGLGNLTSQASPDTGSTVSTHDAAGNLLTQTDAKGQVTTYVYGVLNRVSLITFHDGSKQTYAYDFGTNGIGRLSSITETDPANQQTSLIQYAYSPHGRVTSETRTVGGFQYVLLYRYDGAGRLAGLTYPSGRILTYTFDSLGRISGIDTTFDGQAQPVVSGVAYHPFGGVRSYTLGNGQVYSRSYDQDGRINTYTLGAKSYSIGYDAASRIEFISDLGTPANSNTYGYDSLDRLTSAVIPGTSFGYTYDAVGNRLTKTVGAGTDTLIYSTTSNRIDTLTPASGPPRSFVLDPNGSTTGDGLNTYAYDARGRMVQSVGALGATSYQLNALGQRIRKTNSQGDTVFHYDTRGRLIAETGPAGEVKRELIYLGDIPVGVVQ